MLKKVGDKNYVIGTPEGRRKTRLCQVNLLKQYQGKSHIPSVACLFMGQMSEDDVSRDGETIVCGTLKL